jgi:anhydro-N-acetylmuramic acid kinase
MTYKVIGLMSGSSLDGLDIAYCHLEETGGTWRYQIMNSACVALPEHFKTSFVNINNITVHDYLMLDSAFGKWQAQQINTFITNNKLEHKVDVIASHGHTTLHNPSNGYSAQIGCGAQMAAITGIVVINNLRSADVARGGQGAPIVPIAEQLLFANNNAFLNIGGICNITFKTPNNITAFDVCPANRMLNYLSNLIDMPYDAQGAEATKGVIHEGLLQELNALDFYKKIAPKSLANEFGTGVVLPMFEKYNCSVQDKLRTACEHIATQIAHAVNLNNISNEALKILVTGGGAFNTFLIQLITEKCSIHNATIEVPDAETINYKEALAMALIGALRWREEDNVLATVTGASSNSVGGALWLP